MTSSSNYSNGVQVMRAGLRVREYTTPFIVRYKTSNTGAINNSEINNSLNTSMSDIQEAGVSTTTFYGSLSGNASSATKLQTARSLWGNTFDGTQNLTGRLTAAGMTCGYSNTSYAISTSGLISNGWLRTVGQCGWFSQTYGGGWYMTDSTYVRTYGSKAIHIPNSSYYSVNTTGGFYSSWNNNLPYNSTNIIKINSGILNCPELAISANNTCQPVVTWSNVVNGYGYRTRYSIASVRSSAWGSMRLSVGNSDAGTSIGAYIDIHGGGTITLGGTTHGTGGIYSDSYVSAKGNNSSDARLKTDIHGFNATSILKRLKPKAFRWNSTAWGLSDAFKTDELQYGLIAQETKNVLPGIVVDNMFNDGYMGIRYDKLIPVLLQGEIETISRVETLEDKVRRLEKENGKLKKRIKELERRAA